LKVDQEYNKDQLEQYYDLLEGWYDQEGVWNVKVDLYRSGLIAMQVVWIEQSITNSLKIISIDYLLCHRNR